MLNVDNRDFKWYSYLDPIESPNGVNAMIETVQQRKELFQHIILKMERKYDLTTKQAIAMLHQEMQAACYVEALK